MSTFSASIEAKIDNFQANIGKATQSIDKFSKDVGAKTSQVSDSFSNTAKKTKASTEKMSQSMKASGESMNRLSSIAKKAGTAIAGYFAFTQIIDYLIISISIILLFIIVFVNCINKTISVIIS